MIRSRQLRWTAGAGWSEVPTADAPLPPPRAFPQGSTTLVLVFGGRHAMAAQEPFAELGARFPDAIVAGCSTSGEILGTEVTDDGLVATALAFDSTRVALAAEAGAEVGTESSGDADASFLPNGSTRSADLGRRVAERLLAPDLVHVLAFADGIGVNGSELVRGLEAVLPPTVAITGGLAGDGTRFEQTLVRWGQEVSPSGVVGLGFYGGRLHVGSGSLGGWDPFGPERRITRSSGNVLFELDGRPALELYRLYLGEHAAGLPATGLLFPLSLRASEKGAGVVRTIVGIDEQEGSLTFVGDVPEGQLARLMRANLDRLIDGAAGAASATLAGLAGHPAQLALLISCVGRRMILNQRVEEEVESARQILGAAPALTGFYSYGEIAPGSPGARCDLHNQTMTITAMAEA